MSRDEYSSVPRDPRWWESNPEVMLFQELKSLNANVASLAAQMKQALAQGADINNIELRVRDLELHKVAVDSRHTVTMWLLNGAWGLTLAIVGAVAWFK